MTVICPFCGVYLQALLNNSVKIRSKVAGSDIKTGKFEGRSI